MDNVYFSQLDHVTTPMDSGSTSCGSSSRMFLIDHFTSPPRLHNQQLSMVHSEDVAMLMLSLIDAKNDVFNQPYSLAFKETATLKEFLTILGEHVGNTKFVFDESTTDGAVYFPSVKHGPVNTTKAQRMLQWNPVSLKEGIIINYYTRGTMQDTT